MALIQTESGWNPNARSHAGAVGLGQMTPIAVREVQNVYNIDIEPDLTNPCENVVWSVLYFSFVQASTRSQVEALVAYNGGYRQLALYRQRLPIAEETDQYWRRIIKLKRDYDRTFLRPEPYRYAEAWEDLHQLRQYLVIVTTLEYRQLDIPNWRLVDWNRCQGVFQVFIVAEYVPVRPDSWRSELKFPWGPAEEYSRR